MTAGLDVGLMTGGEKKAQWFNQPTHLSSCCPHPLFSSDCHSPRNSVPVQLGVSMHRPLITSTLKSPRSVENTAYPRPPARTSPKIHQTLRTSKRNVGPCKNIGHPDSYCTHFPSSTALSPRKGGMGGHTTSTSPRLLPSLPRMHAIHINMHMQIWN